MLPSAAPHSCCSYCECFASGRYCDNCNCLSCFNNKDNEAVRQAAVEAILERNPNAFRPKIQVRAAGQGRGTCNSAATYRHSCSDDHHCAPCRGV